MTKQSLFALLVSSTVAASACGGGSSDQASPASAPAEAPAAAPTPAPEPQPAAPPAETTPAPQAAAASRAATPPAAAPAPAPGPPSFARIDIKAGTGREATAGRQISVHYTGWLYDPTRPEQKGRPFDSSVERGQPFAFTLGAGQVIPGWDQGFVGMKVGGRRRLVIPPDLGYGASGFGGGIIPPNATLIFDMELMDVAP